MLVLLLMKPTSNFANFIYFEVDNQYYYLQLKAYLNHSLSLYHEAKLLTYCRKSIEFLD
jgi:hypothetical protein